MGIDPKFGDVFLWHDYRFADKGIADKRYIVLGAKPALDIIGAITTSVQGQKPFTAGCSPTDGIYFAPRGTAPVFQLDTWVQLYRPQIITSTEMRQRIKAGNIKLLGTLPPMIANAIRNCLKQTDDISPKQLALLE